jgi:hypothetical protein
MFAELAAAASSLGTIKDLASALINERDGHKSTAIKIDFTEKLIHLQHQFLEVHSAVISKDALIHSLTQRVRELEGEKSEKGRYMLTKLGSDGDFFAYKLRSPGELVERQDEAPHFVCQPCFDRGEKSVLHVGEYNAFCPLCKQAASLRRVVVRRSNPNPY